ncbi:serine/threonine-protein kinase [Pseudarthrobacter sp. So.54]
MQIAQTGQALGASYRFGERVGSGAVGDVWTVTSADGQTFAAKVLRPEHADDPSLVERFVRERSVLLGLRDPHIVTVRDMVVEGPRLAIVMDYIAGGSLRDAVKETGPLRPLDALTVTAEVFDALAFAHARGVTHRDIKPDNVLLTRPWPECGVGDVRVSDFGISNVVGERIRQTTGLIGTPLYMPPELISRGLSGPPGDVYSTGVMLYELLAGRTPFAGPGTDFSVAYRHVSARPPRIPVDDAVWDVLDGLLSKDPAQRPTAAEAASTLRRLAPRLALSSAAIARGKPPLTSPPSTAPRLWSGALSRRRNSQPWRRLLPPETAGRLRNSGKRAARRSPVQSRVAWCGRWRKSGPRKPLPSLSGARAKPCCSLRHRWPFARSDGCRVRCPGTGKPAERACGRRERLSAQLQDTALPTGLTISRAASYEPSSGQIRLTIAYAAQKAPLSGDFLEVIPGLAGGDACPAASWDGSSVSRNQPSITGLDVECGWKVSGLEIPAGGSVQVTATVPVSPADQKALDAWLRAGSGTTTTATQDPAVKSTEYPVQRLKGVEVRTPTRVVTPSPLKITLVPVWAGGADELNPMYVSPTSGKPSQMLVAVSGGEKGVRFSDGCGGALAVDSAGLTVTALQITPQCTVRASVGNFTELQSQSFGITSRENSQD